LIGVAASIAGKFPVLPAKAETPAALTEQNPALEEEEEEEVDIKKHQNQNQSDPSTPLQAFLESNAEAIESLKSLLQQKLENGQDEEALKIIKLLVSAQPEVTEWKFLMARLLNETGRAQDARNVFEEILVANPLSFEALFENALLMDRCGEGEAVIRRLQGALDIAEEENKVKEARDVRLIMAQIHFLQKNVEEALKSYQELSKEDPEDFRPYFCRGMIYSLLDRNEEAKEQFAKYRELSPKKFEVEGYLRTSLSRMKLFGSNEKN
jgi:tetratricopeptide (TPR) repeat protein